MKEHYQEVLKGVEEEIAGLDIPSGPALLYDPVRYIMALGGKRVRPVLTLLACELYGQPHANAMNQAMAVELFHNFTLVHDDVMDSADVRRKLPTVHKKWDHNVALLSGDAMIVLAYQKLMDSKADVRALAKVFSQSAIEVCEGQQLDMDFAKREQLAMSEYIEMIRLKTAVLLSCSMQLGAIVAGADQGELIKLKTFAEALGLAFQVKDDYLDTFGDEDFGKAIGGDIAEGKRTWLTVKSFELATDEQHKRLTEAFELDDLKQRVVEVKRIYDELGIRRLANDTVNDYSAKAKNALSEIEGQSEAKETLSWLVEQLIGRTV